MIKKLVLLMLFFITIQKSNAQLISDSVEVLPSSKIFGLTPAKKSTHIHGIALGLMASAKKLDTLHISGLNLELGPFVLIGLPYFVIGSIIAPFNRDTTRKNAGGVMTNYNIFEDSVLVGNSKIEGLSIGILGSTESNYLNGVGISGLVSFYDKMNGLVVSGLINGQYEFKGVSIAVFRNKTTLGTGVQIGLFNTSKTGNLIQIGLLNRIGNRVTPFINFRFKSKKIRSQNHPQ